MLQVVARLKETVEWRRSERPEMIACDMCLKSPNSHYFHPVGFSKEQHPVMYSCSGMVTDRSPEGNKKHMIMTFEQTIALMPEGVEKWMWFADFEGFGYKDLGVVRFCQRQFDLQIQLVNMPSLLKRYRVTPRFLCTAIE